MSEDTKTEIKKLYSSGMGCAQISKHINHSNSYIFNFLKSENMIDPDRNPRKYHFINENYFENIDSVEKTYFLGLLWADGSNIRRDKNRKVGRISLQLKSDDRYIIERLCLNLYGNTTMIKERVPYKGFSNGITKHSYVCITSSKLSDDLLKLGMIPNKSQTLEMPNIEWSEELFRGFLLGYNDGDGCISRSGNQFAVKIISGVEHIKQMNNLLEKFYGSRLGEYQFTRYNHPMAYLNSGGNIKIYKFLTWLYKDTTIYLTRKYEKFLKLKEMVESKYPDL